MYIYILELYIWNVVKLSPGDGTSASGAISIDYSIYE